MAAPAFGELKAAGACSDGCGGLVHGNEVGVHALGDVEPVFLAGVSGESLPFFEMHASGVHVETRVDGAAQGIAKTMGHGVIDGDVVAEAGCGWSGLEIGDAVGKGCGDGESAGGHVVFHVVRWGVGEYDGGLSLADHGCDLAEQRHRVGEL